MHQRSLARRLAPLSLALGLVWASTGGAQAPEPAPAPASFQVLAEQVAALFPVVQTEVVDVSGDRVTLAAGRREGVRRGLALAAFREGRELYHPTTKQLLGRTEETLARLRVVEAHEAYAVATVVGSPERPIRAGDRARTSSDKLRLTMVSLASGVRPGVVEAATDALAKELERTGRVQVLFGDRIALWLAEQRISAEEFLDGKGVREAGERFALADLLAVRFVLAQGKPFMDIRLFAGAPDAAGLRQALFVPSAVRAPVAQPFSTGGTGNVQARKRSLLERLLSGNLAPNEYSAAAASIPLRSLATFPFVVTSMDVAVSPADGVPRMVLTDGRRVFVYRVTPEKLEPEWTHDKLMVGSILSVQFADLDRDKVLDVVVNRQDVQAGMFSYILTGRDGRPQTMVKDIPLLLLAMDETGEGLPRVLWGHPQDRDTFFRRGAATRYTLRDDDIAADGYATVNSTLRLTGATFAAVGKGERVVAFIDEHNRLKVTSPQGEELWRSLAVVGGGIAQAHYQVVVTPTIVDKFVKMEPRPLAVDLDGDGIQEIVVPVNENDAGQMAVVFKGPTGFRIQVVSSGLQGMVTGLGAIPGDGNPSLIAAVVQRTGFWGKQGSTQIIMTLPSE
ncbi:MAG: hypothetical protein HYU51_07755 [Candidatus Rokubacteria bacterium]|nr:hypothetical protein [Candidatus Rokubacteria bacterium]